MKTMCPPGYHHNGFVATHALGHMMYGYLASVRFEHSVCRGSLMTTNIYIYIYIYVYNLPIVLPVSFKTTENLR